MYLRFCKKYKAECVLTLKTRNIESNTRQFISKIKDVNSKVAMAGLYKDLKSYKLYITLSESDKRIHLLDKTYDIFQNINLFADYSKESLYLHMSSYGNNSKFMHFGVAHALKKLDYKHEMFVYLSENAEHDGFINVLKNFEKLNNKEMCQKLFNRFFYFCEFLYSRH